MILTIFALVVSAIIALITSFSMAWAKDNIPQLQAIGGLMGIY